MRAASEPQREAQNTQSKKILTPEQYTKYPEEEKNYNNTAKKNKKGGDRKSKKSNS